MVKHAFRKLQLIRRNYEWLAADFPLADKLRYYPSMVSSYSRLLIQRKKYIDFFGTNFYYDNIATPLNLQNYPYEVSHKILRNTAGKIRYALDIGGNIGQFPATLERLCPDLVHVDVLEPNPVIFELLQKNVGSSKKVKTYNYALGKKADSTFYFEEGRSAIGSFIKENASDRQGRLTKVNVQTTNDLVALTKRKMYDLIIIDVEGYEYTVLSVLKGVSARYLYLEASGAGRQKNYEHNELFSLIEKLFGAFDIVYQSELNGPMATIEYLFQFGKTKS